VTLTPTARAILGLGFTQIVGWGTTYLMPSVLGRDLQRDLGLSPELVFAGITVMFAISAVCSLGADSSLFSSSRTRPCRSPATSGALTRAPLTL